MTEVSVVQQLAYPADVVWAMVGDFGGLHRWHPHVLGLDLSWEGRIRTVHYANGSRAVERLEARSDASRRYVYMVVDGQVPVQNCRSTLQVSQRPGGSAVMWSCEFEPLGDGEHSASETLQTHYREGLIALISALDAQTQALN
jgi:mxaD protein